MCSGLLAWQQSELVSNTLSVKPQILETCHNVVLDMFADQQPTCKSSIYHSKRTEVCKKYTENINNYSFRIGKLYIYYSNLLFKLLFVTQ